MGWVHLDCHFITEAHIQESNVLVKTKYSIKIGTHSEMNARGRTFTTDISTPSLVPFQCLLWAPTGDLLSRMASPCEMASASPWQNGVSV